MFTTAIASVALLATTALAGNAIVVNSCNYDVYLQNTPADGGGATMDSQTLSSGGTYSQQFTSLSNGNGWSIKLSQSAGSFGSNIMQYEYTYHNDGIIWYDLSEVDGNPWDGNWEITATGSCSPKQAAYRYSTDDAYGMQSCPSDASITVTLCSGSSGGAAPSSPKESAAPTQTSWGAPAPTSEAPAPTSEAPTSAAPPASTPSWGGHGHHSWNFGGKNVEAPAGDEVAEKKVPSPSTMVTSSVDAWNGPKVTVTNMHYETVTQTVTAHAHKRHVHHPRHPHH